MSSSELHLAILNLALVVLVGSPVGPGFLVWQDTIAQTINGVMSNPIPAIEVGFASVYGTLAYSAKVRKEWVHMIAYLMATGLALALAACTAH